MKKLALVLVVLALICTVALSACKPTTYTVTFSYNYENAPDNGTYKSVTVNSGEKVDKPADPTRNGFEFTGWVTTATGTTPFSFDNSVESDVTVYASWKATEPTPPRR